MKFLTCFLCLVAAAAAAAESRPNIVMILVDDLGYADLSCYGSEVHRTPNIDRLAAEGVRFTDFHSNAAVCSPTRTAFLTGHYPQRYGIEAAIGFVRDEGVPLSATMVSEVLRAAGYRTGVFGKWHVGHVERYGPNDQGFDESRCANNNPDYHSHVSRDGKLDWYRDQKLEDEPGYLVDVVTKHATRFIGENKARPFFLYVPHLSGHFPFQGPSDPPERKLGKTYNGDSKNGALPKSQYKRAYREMVEAVDASVGKIVAALTEAGVRERTLIILSSDNGGNGDVSVNAPYRGAKGGLFEGGHRVPTIANWPGRIRPGTTSSMVQTVDFMPTFIAVTGAKTPAGLKLDGVDLSGLLFRGETLAPRTFYWREAQEKAVRDGAWKLIEGGEAPGLYNLDRDPGETSDLSKAEPARVRELTAKLAAWEADVGPRRDRRAAAGKER